MVVLCVDGLKKKSHVVTPELSGFFLRGPALSAKCDTKSEEKKKQQILNPYVHPSCRVKRRWCWCGGGIRSFLFGFVIEKEIREFSALQFTAWCTFCFFCFLTWHLLHCFRGCHVNSQNHRLSISSCVCFSDLVLCILRVCVECVWDGLRGICNKQDFVFLFIFRMSGGKAMCCLLIHVKWSSMWIQYQRSVLHNFFLRRMRPGRVFTILVCLEVNKGGQRWREELLLWSSTRPTFSPCPSISEKCRYPWKRFSIFFKKRRHGTLCQLDLCVCLFFELVFFLSFLGPWPFLLRVVSRSRSDFVFFGWVPVRVRRKRKFAWNISFIQVHYSLY